MLEFRQIQLSDRDRVNKSLKESDFMGCEYSFANNLAWCRLAGSEICFFKDFYIVCAFETDDRIPLFTLPSGAGDYHEVISEMKRFAENSGCPLQISGVTENSLEMLKELFPDSFDFSLDRDGSDYIYLRSDLAELAGKKYHHKRTHLARFNELEYEFSLIRETDYDDCMSFIADDYNSREDSGTNHSSIAEQYAVNTFFNFFQELNLFGGIIRINGKTAAVTVGEKLNSDTFCIHIEKADRKYSGIYAGINNCFVRACTDGYKYINREEDLGIDGLRKSKLSYYPAFLLNKYIVKFR